MAAEAKAALTVISALQHGIVQIQPHNLGARSGSLASELSRAATQVKNSLPGRGPQKFEQALTVLEHK